jgi:hypothetical protein
MHKTQLSSIELFRFDMALNGKGLILCFAIRTNGCFAIRTNGLLAVNIA